MRKIRLSFSAPVQIQEAGSSEISEDLLKSFIDESRWRFGEGMIGGRKMKLDRRKELDEMVYRTHLARQTLAPGQVEYWNASEYLDWRDS